MDKIDRKAERRAKSQLIQEKQKSYLALQRELNELYRLRHRLPLEELNPPLFAGYKKFFVINEKLVRPNDRGVMTAILNEVQRTIYCKSPDFKARKWYSKQMEDIEHTPLTISAPKMERLMSNHWGERHMRLFKFNRNSYTRAWLNTWELEHWDEYLLSKVDTHFITHVRKHDVEIEARLGEIKAHIDKLDLWPKIGRAAGKRTNNYDRDWDRDTKRLIVARANSSMYAQLDEWIMSGFEEPFNDPHYKFKP